LEICRTQAFEEGEVPLVTKGLEVDLETSLDAPIDKFIRKLQERLTANHSMFDPINQ